MPITRRNMLQAIAAGTVAAVLQHGGDNPTLQGAPVSGPILLNRNENPYGASEKVQAVIRDAAAASHLYPRAEYDSLRKMLADQHKVTPEQIVLGAGSTEILRIAGSAFLRPGKKLIVASPTYSSLANFAEANGVEAVEIPLTKTYEHDLDGMLARANASTGLVYICNPNNPTGTLTPRRSIEAFISKLPSNVMLLIDEAYHHFVGGTSSYQSFLDHPFDHPRLIVSRTFSKIYGLAGMRVGYSVSSKEVASRLSSLRLPFGLSIVSLKAAMAAMLDTSYLRMAVERNANDRQEFFNQVNARMLRALDSHANFVLMNAMRPVKEALAHLEKNNILIAPAIPLMERYIRVSLGTAAEMQEFWRVWDLMPVGAMAM